MCTVECVLGKGFYSPWWYLLIRKSMSPNKMQIHKNKNFLLKYRGMMEFLAFAFLRFRMEILRRRILKYPPGLILGLLNHPTLPAKCKASSAAVLALQIQEQFNVSQGYNIGGCVLGTWPDLPGGLVMDQNKVTPMLESLEFLLATFGPIHGAHGWVFNAVL